MTNEEFSKILEIRLMKCREKLKEKANEYAREDRLSNFKRATAIRRNTYPESVLLDMMLKHWVSIVDMIEDLGEGALAEDSLWDEKITDAINYLILLEAMVAERRRDDIQV